MAVFVRPPTADEMQYAGDVIRGKRSLDVRIIIAFTVLGALCGIVIGFAGAAAHNEPVDPAFVATCLGLVAITFAVIAAMALYSYRSLKAVCEAWLPARLIVAVVGIFAAYRIIGNVRLSLIMGTTIQQIIVVNAMGLVFALLFLNLGIRFIFNLYCMATGRDEDEIVTRNISASHEAKRKRKQNPPAR